jgi:hypothetical protein
MERAFTLAQALQSSSQCYSEESGVAKSLFETFWSSLGLIVALVHDKEAKAVEVLRSFDMGSLPIR